MFLPSVPLISASLFGAALQRMLAFVALRIRRSDQGMAPSLSPGLRAQTVALHGRLTTFAREFQRLAALARAGRLRVHRDRKPPSPRAEAKAGQAAAASRAPAAASAFGESTVVAQGPTLPAMPTRGAGWMLGFLPAEYREAFAVFLADADVVALIQASPAVARLLRPLCHGLGVVPPEGVFPRRRRGATACKPRRDARPRRRASVPGACDVVMSPQARERWWAATPGGGRAAGPVPAGGRFAKR